VVDKEMNNAMLGGLSFSLFESVREMVSLRRWIFGQSRKPEYVKDVESGRIV
jgi:hypothetical protein